MQIPKAWNWEHLSNKLSLLKMLLEPKKPTDFVPAVNTFKNQDQPVCTAGVCQVPDRFSRNFLLEQRGDTGTGGEGSLSLRAAPPVPFPPVCILQPGRVMMPRC